MTAHFLGARVRRVFPMTSDRSSNGPATLMVGAMTIVIALVGGRRGRRAALRAAVGTGLAAALPVGRTTGTAVSALVTSTALEFPMGTAPAAVLATVIAERRLRARPAATHQIALESVTGTVAALATTRFWPLADNSPAAARRVPRGVASCPSADGSGLTIVVNPSAGAGRLKSPLTVVAEELPEARIVELSPEADVDEVFRDAAAGGGTLGVVGGDGTINAAANAAIDADCPLAVFPGGTLNHFARDLGLETIDDAVAAVRDGALVTVDVGLIDGRPFLNTASFGSYTTFVTKRERLEGRIGKWPAMCVALVSTLLHEAPLDVRIDGRAARVWMIFIGNCAYDPPGFAPTSRSRLDDNLFDVRIVDGTTPWARVRLTIAVLTGQLARSSVYTRRLQSRLEVSGLGADSDLAADGEVFRGSDRFVVEKHASPLLVHAPATG